MRKIRIAQVGTNHPHAQFATATILRSSDFDLVGYAEPCPERTHPEAKRLDEAPYAGLRRYTVEELLEMDDLDAVAIECAEVDSTKYAQMFAQKGVHIYLDKPGSHGVASFEKLVNTCREKGVLLRMGYMYRYNPLVRKALELVKEGKLGEIYSVEAQMSHHYPENLSRWVGQHKGGMMYYLGCHDVDLVLQFMGGLPDEVIPLNCSTGEYGLKGENYGFAVLKYKNGVSFVKSTCAEHNGFDRRQLVVCGSLGSIEIKPFESFFDAATLKSKGVFTFDGRSTVIESEPIDRYGAMFGDLANCIRGVSENEYSYEYELDLFKTLMKCCGVDRLEEC